MTTTLYNNKGSGSFAVEAALGWAGVPYAIVDLDLDKGDQRSADFVRINPMQQVPALVDEHGSVMTESAAIVIHLAIAHPDKGLAPRPGTPAFGQFLRWMVYMSVNLYEGDLRYFYSDRYTSEPAGIEGVKSAAKAHMRRAFAQLEAGPLAAGGFLLGKELSIADVYLAMLTRWSPDPVTSPGITRVVEAVRSHPKLKPLWAKHGFA